MFLQTVRAVRENDPPQWDKKFMNKAELIQAPRNEATLSITKTKQVDFRRRRIVLHDFHQESDEINKILQIL